MKCREMAAVTVVWLLGLPLLTAIVAVAASDASPCIKSTPCICERANGSSVNLTALPWIFARDPSWTYYYQPCATFSMGDGCKNVVACKTNPITRPYYALAYIDEATFVQSGPNLALQYTDGIMLFRVELICFHEDYNNFTVINATEYTYVLSLQTRLAC